MAKIQDETLLKVLLRDNTATRPINWASGTAVTAGQYWIGRDTDATNQFHLNAPTGAGFELSVNDVAVGTWATNNFTILASNGTDGMQFLSAAPNFGILSLGSVNTQLQIQQKTFTAGAAHIAVSSAVSWTAEDFAHTAYFIKASQYGSNSVSLNAFLVEWAKFTGASTLALARGIWMEGPSVTGTVTAAHGISIDDQSMAGIGSSFAINIASQGVGATTTRAINIAGTGLSNSIAWGASAVQYSNAAQNIRFADSTNANGIDFNLLSTAVQTINTVSNTTGVIQFQNQTFTAGAGHFAVQINPAWATENQFHTALDISPTQNGANTIELRAINITMAKATGATTLAKMNGILFAAPSVVGTVTNSQVIDIVDQTNANITTPRGILFETAGVANSIVWGGSALQYANGANNIRLADATNANGIDFNLLATANQTINTISATTGSLILQNQTFTAGAGHAAVQITPAWASENFGHTAWYVSAAQAGANTVSLAGINLQMLKATALTTLANMYAIDVQSPGITGTVTNSFALYINDQTNANITTPRSIYFTTAGVANSIVWGGSALQYATGANNISFMDSTNARGIVHTLTAAGVQTITTSASDLSLSASTGIVAMTSARHETAKGADVGSANDLTLGADGNIFNITGAVTINAIISTNWQAGSVIVLLFAGAPLVKHNTAGGAGTAKMFLAGSADFQAAANSVLTLFYDGTQFQELARKVA